MQKTIFITGASAGLGKATAKLFQSKGWKVVATMRNPEKETELTKLNHVTVLPLDVTDLAQIKSTVERTITLGGTDVVFNNAGYALTGALESISDDKMVRQINTNLLGTLRVTQAFIPYFRQRRNGLFIATTSIGGIYTFPLNSLYHATKWALEGWSESMSFELAAFNIGIKTIAPGGIITDFMDRSLDANSLPEYQQLENKVANGMSEGLKTASTAEQIAEVVYEAATDGKDQVRYVAGADAKAMYARRLEIGNEASRKEIGSLFLA
ncbi:MAG: SDR family oxidoreductase [Cyclobacteriaceae bacterium]